MLHEDDGSRVFRNKHSRAEFEAIAEGGTILRCLVGSGVHGTAVEGQDDRDERASAPSRPST